MIMDNRFKKLVELEIRYQQLTKKRDDMSIVDDSDISGFELYSILSEIARVEKEIQAIRKHATVSR